MATQMTRAEYEAKYGSPPPAPVRMTRSEYEAKYTPEGGLLPSQGLFNVPSTREQREPQQEKIARLQREAQQAEKKAKRAKSPFGFAANTAAAIGENIMESAVGLGKTIAKVSSGKSRDRVTQGILDLQNTQAELLKTIRQRESRGEDTTKLKQIFNDNAAEIKRQEGTLREFTDTLPTTGQVVGQLGGVALDVLSAGTYGKGARSLKSGRLALPSATRAAATAAGAPELGKVATQKASGLFTRKGAANVAQGAGLGYASDVTRGLQGLRGEEREGGKAFIPGAGTAIGAAIPAVSEGVQSIKNVRDPKVRAQKLADKRRVQLDKLDRYKSIQKAIEKGDQRGIDIKKMLSETDVLHGSVDKTGNISTKGAGGAIDQYTQQFIDGNEALVGDILKKEGRAISPELIRKKLDKAVLDAGIEGRALTNARKAIDDEIAGYAIRATDSGAIPVSTLHNAKIDKYNNINFFTEGNVKKYDKTVAKALKELVEESTTSADVSAINRELSKHFAVIDYLKRLDGRKVEGGKLGKYFAQTIGAVVGSQFGPLGAIVGAEAGSIYKGNQMASVFKGQTGIQPQQSPIITEALQVRDAPALQLPSGQSRSSSLGSLNSNQANTIIPTNTGISNILPSSSPQVNNLIKNLRTSGLDYDKAIQAGDIPVNQVYTAGIGSALIPERVGHVIDDLAGKLNMYSQGLGEEFIKTVDTSNATPANLSGQAIEFLKRFLRK